MGWTIRTCKNSGENEFLLFYKNRLSYDKLVKLLKIKLQKNSNEFYIIYPSWSFLFSFNIIKEMNRYIIEGVYKSQKTISAYSKLPDFVFIYDRVTDRFMSKIDCNQESLLIHSIRKVIKHMENIHYNNCYSEVAFTTERKIFFYEFWLL
ncbi:hypothetical protein HQ49_07690 [Porphyromonas gulae]|nr:hypothetical protein HQ49_07690 [Porphyromonas gulae]